MIGRVRAASPPSSPSSSLRAAAAAARSSGPCSLTDECGDGQVCDFTAEGGPVCVSADGDSDSDGLPNGKDFCQHAPGGASDEDRTASATIATAVRSRRRARNADPDGDMRSTAPCDPAPERARRRDPPVRRFPAGLDARWKPTTASAWTVKPAARLIGNLDSVEHAGLLADQRRRQVEHRRSRPPIASTSRGERDRAQRRRVPRRSASRRCRQMQCGVTKADAGVSELVSSRPTWAR